MSTGPCHPMRKVKVKSGCRTCKTRKVKCDEGRPFCHRCVSAGRKCDGYGIWNSVSAANWHRRCPLTLENDFAPRLCARPSVSTFDIEDSRLLEWFKRRVAVKLPGSFSSDFWGVLLFRASVSEPAVLHAVLALSSVHKAGVIEAGAGIKVDERLKCQEDLTLRHYIGATSHLQRVFSKRECKSSRIALITCIVFVCVEILRGHFRAAQVHLENGTNIMREAHSCSNGNQQIVPFKNHRDQIDDCITEAFLRFHLQMNLSKYFYGQPCSIFPNVSPKSPVFVFRCFKDAWQHLQQLFSSIFDLGNQSRQRALSDCESYPLSSTMLTYQKQIQADLLQWLKVYEAFKENLQSGRTPEIEMICNLLDAYHVMAFIMVDTCPRLNDESVYDFYTDRFLLMIKKLADMWKVASRASLAHALPHLVLDMSHSTIDLGWIPLLYFTAIKCRIHRIRLQAIRLLECCSHREGIWDSHITACIASKVVALEEKDFYRMQGIVDDFSASSYPSSQDLSLEALPKSCRIHGIDVIVSGAPVDKILILSKPGAGQTALLSEYSIHYRRWRDGE